MPLLLSKPISPYSAYAVWNIQETNQVLLGLIKEDVPKGLNPTRLAEWIVGRILIQNLCAQFALKYRGLTPNESGKPFLIGSSAEISISHSFPMAAAMIHLHNPCGIDLERARNKLVKIQDKFVNEREIAYRDNLQKLCAIWCGKEVLYKIYGRKKLSMRDETFIEFETDSVMNGIIQKDQIELHYRIHYEAVRDYFLAYSL
ncbi:MAG: 4'-phosphopantetheinyl transferase superfamily protein [Marinoscillum sp.]|uniref:4'-phosphopantetheinyl transferase family protein n=1 Tax=Marinoscillum sp. TaxID=2024838 RepID=UPI0032F36D5C